LASDEIAVLASVGLPVCNFRVPGSPSDHCVLHEDGNNLGETYGFFFSVGEARHFSPFHNEFTVFVPGIDESNWSMAHGGYGLVGCPELFDQPDGRLVVYEIPERAVSSGVEDRIKVAGRKRVQPDCGGKFGVRSAISLEPTSRLGLRVGVVALGIEMDSENLPVHQERVFSSPIWYRP
jgi:hypothetical protein